MKLTWEYHSETGQKIAVSIEPETVNMLLVNDFARLIGVLGKDQVLLKKALESPQGFSELSEESSSED